MHDASSVLTGPEGLVIMLWGSLFQKAGYVTLVYVRVSKQIT